MTVSLSQIESHLVESTEPPVQTEKARAKANPNEYTERKGRALLYAAKWDHCAEGERNQAAFRHAADLLRDFDLPENDAWEIIRQWNDGNGPPLDERELRQAFDDGLKYGKHPPGAKLDRKKPKTRKRATEEPPTNRRIEGLILRVQRADMRAVEWLVVGHIACGKLTIIAGLPGAGKSLFILWLVAAMQGRKQLPDLSDGTPATIMRGEALLVTCEDDPYDTIAPRLAAYGIDPAILPVYQGTRTIEEDGTEVVSLFDVNLHLPAIEQFLTDNPDTKLLIIDPVQTFLGQTELNANTAINVALGSIAAMAQHHGIAVLLVTHFNKRGDQAALDRIIGSRGFTGTVRAAFQVTPDREVKGRCILSCTKQQNGPKPDAMGYCIKGVPVTIAGGIQSVPVIEFEPNRIEADPDELIKPESEQPRIGACVAWLRERLAAGATLATTIQSEGEAKGFSEDVVRRARIRLQLIVSKTGFQGKSFWGLPEKGENGQ